MAFNLIEGDGGHAGAVPLTVLSKAGLAAWRETAPARERDWAAATGFTGEAGKLALVPDQAGKLGRVLVGASENDAAMWALAGLSEKLPEGNYRLERGPDGGDPTRLALGWALGTYAFTLYRDKKKEYRARLVWPEGADRGLAERLANAVCLARDLINTPASDLGPAELAEAAVTVAENAGAKHRVITGDALLAENYPTIHAVGRASSRQPRLVDIRWGDEHAPKVTLVGKGVCFDSGGLDLKPASGMRMMKKDMGGAAIMLGLAQAIMQGGVPVRLRVLLPLVENAVSGNAMRPLDIVKTRKDRQHRRRGTAHPVRCARRGVHGTAGDDRRCRDPDRRGAGRARAGTAGIVLQRRQARRRADRGGHGGGRPDVAPAVVALLPQAPRQQGGRHQQRIGRAACRGDYGSALSAGICRARDPVGASRCHGVEHKDAAGPSGRRRGANLARGVRVHHPAIRASLTKELSRPASRGRISTS